MATTAFQTLWPVRMRRAEEQRRQAADADRSDPESGHDGAPALLNTCHAYADTRNVVRRRWPQLYRGPDDAG